MAVAPEEAVTFADVKGAARALAGLVRETPMLSAGELSRRVGARVVLKAENLQLTGSFKARGATHMIRGLPRDALEAGVVAASAGNHAQAVAFAAREAGARAVLVMPAQAPLAKVAAVQQYGGEVRFVDGGYDEAQAEARRLADAEGYTEVHAFDQPEVVAGQGTIGLEIARQAPDVSLVVVPLGGGGLASGIGLALDRALKNVRVVGVQAEACAPYIDSLAAHRPIGARSANTICDGIAVKRPGDFTLPLVQRYVNQVVTVSDDEVAQAMVLLLERSKLVVEGAGAVAVAALMHGRVRPPESGSVCARCCRAGTSTCRCSRRRSGWARPPPGAGWCSRRWSRTGRAPWRGCCGWWRTTAATSSTSSTCATASRSTCARPRSSSCSRRAGPRQPGDPRRGARGGVLGACGDRGLGPARPLAHAALGRREPLVPGPAHQGLATSF